MRPRTQCAPKTQIYNMTNGIDFLNHNDLGFCGWGNKRRGNISVRTDIYRFAQNNSCRCGVDELLPWLKWNISHTHILPTPPRTPNCVEHNISHDIKANICKLWCVLFGEDWWFSGNTEKSLSDLIVKIGEWNWQNDNHDKLQMFVIFKIATIDKLTNLTN